MGDGFPKGLRPANWMGDFFEKKLDPERQKTWLVTDFIYPGSHDAATYGSGAASFSYQCQDKTLFEQMMVGQRAFDLRLAPKEGGKFQPVHGAAKGTADDFNNGPNSADDKDLAGQIMRFAKQHPTEIVILKITMDGLDTDQEKHAWAEAAWNLLGKRMLRTPQKGEDQVTYKEAVDSGKNIILAMLKKNAAKEKHDLHTYYWDVTRGDANNWLGNADQKLWNEPDWQSGNIDKVLKSTESWIDDNQNKLQKRDKFWVAMLQLTPALGQGISTFIKDGASVRPKDLALGGGIDIFGKGHFDGSNKHLRESGVLRKPIWKKHSSIILYDFADTHTTGCIVGMNLGDDDPDDVDAGKGAGGKGGGSGGRGGRGGGGDHEGGRGGRGGRGGGGGGGGGNKADDVKDKAKDLLGGLGKKF